MSANPAAGRHTVYTIGHSNQSLEAFLGLLKTHRIEILADVRSQPVSQYTPHFNSGPLKAEMLAAGVEYLFLGKELGGRPQGGKFYDEQGYVLYARVAEAPFFKQGLARLEDLAGRRRVALMCGEEDPSSCHRRLLVGRVLAQRGFRVLHIRGDGSLLAEEELKRVEQFARDHGQLTLFQTQEEPEWKSTQSVSPKSRPVSSSER
jgi:uncharacterized protein (DUF488 family)